MTIIEAINKIDSLKPNTYTQNEKIKWLSALDALIYKEIIAPHQTNTVLINIPFNETEENQSDEISVFVNGNEYTIKRGENVRLPEEDVIIFRGYTEYTPINTVLIAKEPYDEMYIHWLESKIDYYNAEYAHYNNSVTTFGNMYSEFSRYYNRTHKPKTKKIKYF